MLLTQTDPDPTARRISSAVQLAEVLRRGASALVISVEGSAALLTETAALLTFRTRVLRVRPPYNLTSFMRQLAPSANADDDVLLEAAYRGLTVVDPACDRIVLLAEDAHLLPKATLRYLEVTLRSTRHLCICLAGQPGLEDLLSEHGLNDLRTRLSFHRVLPASGPAGNVPVAHSTETVPRNVSVAPSRSRRVWLLVGIASAVCAGFTGFKLSTFLPPGDRGLDVLQSADPTPNSNTPPGAMPAAANGAEPSAVADAAIKPPVVEPTMVPLPSGRAVSDAALVAKPPAVADATIKPTVVESTMVPVPGGRAVSDAVYVAKPPAVADAAIKAPVVEPTMVALRGGDFRMGSTEDASERPSHMVTVAPFLLAEKAITVDKWQQCVDASACPTVIKGEPDAPVTNVSWDDARAYVAWLSRSTNKPYRLPTEAEWEFAARAGTATRYAWGDTMMSGRTSCKGCGAPVSLHTPPRVDAYPPNAFGLYGMGGGAAEWVADCWHRNYQGAPRNGSTPWDSLDCRERVLRGGSWVDEAGSLRASSRDFYDASVRYPTHGFRVARSK